MFQWVKNLFVKNHVEKEPLPVPKIEEQAGTTVDKFTFAFNYTLQNEGALSNDAFDAGGMTKYGIIKDDLQRMGWKTSDEEIKNLTLDKAKQIYKKLYWDALYLDNINSRAIATALFDIGVVRGVGIPPKYVSEIFNIPSSSKMGIWHFEKLNKADEKWFCKVFADRCASGFKQITYFNWTQIRFLKGWLARSERLKSLPLS